YTNSNIDVLYQNDVVKIDAIKRKDIPGDKSIYDIYCYQGKAYLSTGLGVVVIDESKYEVKDTYVIGKSGKNIKVNGFSTDGNSFYAASEEGLKKASLDSGNLADYRNWQLQIGSHGLANGACQQVLNVENRSEER